MDKQNIYLTSLISEIPRILGQLDKDELSSTYGCFDRNFWKYMTRDYANARLQEATYTLALVYNIEDAKNPYYKDERLLKYTVAGMNFWQSLQHRNGSFDEYYAKEKSHVATAFSSLAILEAYDLLDRDHQKRVHSVVTALEKAAHWLQDHDDALVINHDTACVPLYSYLYRLTKEKKYLSWRKQKVALIKKHFSSEGWFLEYGGADVGYQSYSIYFLAKDYQISRDTEVFDIVTKAVHFFSYFIRPDGRIGGCIGSRDTDFVIPAGFELLSSELNEASEIAYWLRNSLHKKSIVGPYSFDNRFLLQEGYVYLDAACYAKQNGFKKAHQRRVVLPYKQHKMVKHFPGAGLCFCKQKNKYVMFNLKKGGYGHLFKKNHLVKTFGFYEFLRGNSIYSTYAESTYCFVDNHIKITALFRPYKNTRQRTITLLGIKILASLGFSSFLKWLMRKRLILQKKTSPYWFIRDIDLSTFEVCNKWSPKIETSVTERFQSRIYSTSTDFWY